MGGSRITTFMEGDVRRKYKWVERKVPTVDIAEILEAIRTHSDVAQGGFMAGKMDIEGAEKQVLPHLRSKGLLCANSGLEFLTMETHGGFHISQLNLKSHCKDQRPTDVLDVDCEVRRLELKMRDSFLECGSLSSTARCSKSVSFAGVRE